MYSLFGGKVIFLEGKVGWEKEGIHHEGPPQFRVNHAGCGFVERTPERMTGILVQGPCREVEEEN